jgi:predicted PurR-regulated permease PerM
MADDRTEPPPLSEWWARHRGRLLAAPALLGAWAVLLLLAGWLREVSTPLVIALLLAYILNPAVTRLERFGLPRALGIAGLYLLLLGPVLMLVYFAGPGLLRDLIDESNGLAAALQEFKKNLRDFLDRYPDLGRMVFGRAEESGTSGAFPGGPGPGGPLPGDLEPWIAGWPVLLQTVLGFLVDRGWLGGLTSGTFLTGFYLFFLLWRFNDAVAAVDAHVPRQFRGPVVRTARRVDRMMAGLLRGRLPIMLAVGLLTAGGLRACQAHYSMLIGLAVGAATLVPALPLLVGFVPSVVSAYVSNGGSWEWAAAAGGVMLGIQYLESAVLSPAVQGRRNTLHPMTVILSLLIGVQIGGTFGLLVALPTACLAKVIVTEFVLPPLRKLA